MHCLNLDMIEEIVKTGKAQEKCWLYILNAQCGMTRNGIFLFLIVTMNWGKLRLSKFPGIVVQRQFNQAFQRVWPIQWKIQRNVAHNLFEIRMKTSNPGKCLNSLLGSYLLATTINRSLKAEYLMNLNRTKKYLLLTSKSTFQAPRVVVNMFKIEYLVLACF